MSHFGCWLQRHTQRKQIKTSELVGFVSCGLNCRSLGAFCCAAPATFSVGKQERHGGEERLKASFFVSVSDYKEICCSCFVFKMARESLVCYLLLLLEYINEASR